MGPTIIVWVLENVNLVSDLPILDIVVMSLGVKYPTSGFRCTAGAIIGRDKGLRADTWLLLERYHRKSY